jgi:hypothetical protein
VEAIENVCVRENEDVDPVPPVAPGDFTVLLGAVMAGETLKGLEREMTALDGGPGFRRPGGGLAQTERGGHVVGCGLVRQVVGT